MKKYTLYFLVKGHFTTKDVVLADTPRVNDTVEFFYEEEFKKQTVSGVVFRENELSTRIYLK